MTIRENERLASVETDLRLLRGTVEKMEGKLDRVLLFVEREEAGAIVRARISRRLATVIGVVVAFVGAVGGFVANVVLH